MKTNSYARILVLTFLFFSFSAVAQDVQAVNVIEGGRDFIFAWAAAAQPQTSKFENAGACNEICARDTMYTKGRGQESRFKET